MKFAYGEKCVCLTFWNGLPVFLVGVISDKTSQFGEEPHHVIVNVHEDYRSFIDGNDVSIVSALFVWTKDIAGASTFISALDRALDVAITVRKPKDPQAQIHLQPDPSMVRFKSVEL